MAYRKGNVKIKWNSNFAYAIGVIVSDGNLSPDLRHINITSKDEEMVLNCKKCLGINNKIGKKASGINSEKKYYVLQFGDKNFFDFLLSIGLTPRKSNTMDKLNIPTKYFRHFLRGCIDGDGSISSFNHPESKHKQYRVQLCSGSLKFLEWVMVSCHKLYGLVGGSILKQKNSSTYILTFHKGDSYKLLRWLYKGKPISLSRKREKAYEILNHKDFDCAQERT